MAESDIERSARIVRERELEQLLKIARRVRLRFATPGGELLETIKSERAILESGLAANWPGFDQAHGRRLIDAADEEIVKALWNDKNDATAAEIGHARWRSKVKLMAAEQKAHLAEQQRQAKQKEVEDEEVAEQWRRDAETDVLIQELTKARHEQRLMDAQVPK